MGEYSVGEEDLDASGMRIAVIAARYNEHITKQLVAGALDTLHRHGVREDVPVCWVPGAFEIPLVAMRLASSARYDAVICLGAVIRGDTPHFDYVAGECASGIGRVALATGIPCVFGVLTTDETMTLPLAFRLCPSRQHPRRAASLRSSFVARC